MAFDITSSFEPIRIGISTCLLGEPVRYDGGHKLDRFIVNTLGKYLEFVPVCPETECGLGVPRESMRLEGDIQHPRLITHKTKKDLTEIMETWAAARLEDLAKENLCGFIFKSKSPSSGMERVKVFNDKGQPVKKGSGIFARMFMERFPHLPVEEDGRLHDPKLREDFIERIFIFRRLRQLMTGERSPGALVKFHTRQKLLFMARSANHYRDLGRITARCANDLDAAYQEYHDVMTDALRLKTTVKKQINVMMHAMGYFKKELEADEKQELLELFDAYRDGYVPLIVPLTLLKHYVRKYDQPWLREQTWLNPTPLELQLRNHV